MIAKLANCAMKLATCKYSSRSVESQIQRNKILLIGIEGEESKNV